MPTYKLFVIEDEKSFHADLQIFLEGMGYAVTFAETIANAKRILEKNTFDIALIDIGLPDGSGLELVKLLKRTHYETGIIVISARHGVDDKVEALNHGSDDYLTKPYHLSELNARIKSVIRRKTQGGKEVLKFDNLVFDLSNKKILAYGNAIKFTKKEYEILVFLASNPQLLVSKEAIAERIWGEKTEMLTSYDFVYTQLKNIKRKLSDAGMDQYIKVVYGMGYKFIE
ncbi:MAG: response regulator transcription factor [Bacteroidetes bacterium]|nr:response regulator transcription factor [Bacteroidota bacterium]